MEKATDPKTLPAAANSLKISNLPPPGLQIGESGARSVASPRPARAPQGDDPAAADSQWYVAVVRSNNELSAARLLDKEAIPTFVPLQTLVRREGRKLIRRRVVALRNLIFAKLSPWQATTLDRRSFIVKVLRAPGSVRPTPIAEHELNAFKFMLELSDDSFEFSPERIGLGDEVRVVRGKLKGVHGFVKRVSDTRGIFSVRIGFIGSGSVNIPLSYLRHVKSPRLA